MNPHDPHNPKTTDGKLKPKSRATLPPGTRILTFRWGRRYQASMGVWLCCKGCCCNVSLSTPATIPLSPAGMACMRTWVCYSLARPDVIPRTVTKIRLRHPRIGLDLTLDVVITTHKP